MVFQAGSHPQAKRPTIEAPPVPIVELTVYAGACVAFGRLARTAERVTDLMNDRPEFEFVDTCLQSHDDGHELLVSSVYVARDEIFAVGVGGPRGNPMRRTRTRPIPIELQVGRYDVSGNIHTLPGADPILGFGRRGVMVPLTEATIEWDTSAGRRLASCGTILVNRDLTTWIRPAVGSDVRPPEVVPTLQRRRPPKDFTPQLLGRRR
jgi:hypothetical protein